MRRAKGREREEERGGDGDEARGMGRGEERVKEVRRGWQRKLRRERRAEYMFKFAELSQKHETKIFQCVFMYLIILRVRQYRRHYHRLIRDKFLNLHGDDESLNSPLMVSRLPC